MSAHVEPVVDTDELRDHIRAMYREVAEQPAGDFHFELGRPVAERLGYPREWLDAVPPDALVSFAGVGHMLDLAAIEPGDTVLDLGSGSGTDAFVAAHLTGPTGRVIGVDMTDAQLAKARRLRGGLGLEHVQFVQGLIEARPSTRERRRRDLQRRGQPRARQGRCLRRGGEGAAPRRPLAIADIVSARELIERTRRNVALWAACIAGAVPQEDYLGAIEAAGLRVETVRDNAYAFLSPRAQAAAEKYGVTSVRCLPSSRRTSRARDEHARRARRGRNTRHVPPRCRARSSSVALLSSRSSRRCSHGPRAAWRAPSSCAASPGSGRRGCCASSRAALAIAGRA